MSGNHTDEKEHEFDPNDFDFDNESDDEWRPEKGMTGPVGKMDEMTGKSNLGFKYVQKFNPSVKNDFRWIDKTLNSAYPPDQVFLAPTGNSIIEDVAHLKDQYNPSNEELTQKQNMQIINHGLEVLREQTPRELPAKVSSRPLPAKVSYMKPRYPPKHTRGGASRKMRKSRKTKKPRRARRVKTQMRRKNSSRKSTRRRTRK